MNNKTIRKKDGEPQLTQALSYSAYMIWCNTSCHLGVYTEIVIWVQTLVKILTCPSELMFILVAL